MKQSSSVSKLLNTSSGKSFIQLMSVVTFFGLWQLGAQLGLISEFLVGTPAGIWRRFIASILDYSLFIDTGYTLWEALLGFVIGTLIGTLLGLSLWYSKWAAQITEPFIVAINSVPKIALAPIILLWFGTGLGASIKSSLR
jgi:NitT/TauT family transport system permease protein